MVLSASSVEAIAAGESPYTAALKQGLFAGIGLFGMFLLSRVNVVWLKRGAWLAIIVAFVLLVLVLVIGRSALGNKNWIDVGPFTFQPSEAAKLALALWMATVLDRKAKLLSPGKARPGPRGAPRAPLDDRAHPDGQRPRHRHDRHDDHGGRAVLRRGAAVPVRDRRRHHRGGHGRHGHHQPQPCLPHPVLDGQTCADGSDLNYQSTNGLYGLASGGWFGVGLGQSRQKYSWIPEAHNDFIFAIIGEELGLVGTLVVLVLFAILGTAIYRVVVAQKDMFHRVLAGTIMVWLLGQATVNMAVVTGLAPVVGIPLPVHFLRRLGAAHVLVRDRRSVVPGPGTDGARASSRNGCSGSARPGWRRRCGSGSRHAAQRRPQPGNAASERSRQHSVGTAAKDTAGSAATKRAGQRTTGRTAPSADAGCRTASHHAAPRNAGRQKRRPPELPPPETPHESVNRPP